MPTVNIEGIYGGYIGPGGKTFFWAGVYSADMNDRTTLRTDLNVFADFNPKLPDAYRTEPYLFLGNIQPDLQRSVRTQMNGVKLTGGDTMNYWINDFRPALLETLKQWDFLLINDSGRACFRVSTTCAAPPPASWRWGRTHWRSSAANTAPFCSAGIATSWRPAICSTRFSTPPAPAIVSRAASSATLRAAVSRRKMAISISRNCATR